MAKPAAPWHPDPCLRDLTSRALLEPTGWDVWFPDRAQHAWMVEGRAEIAHSLGGALHGGKRST